MEHLAKKTTTVNREGPGRYDSDYDAAYPKAPSAPSEGLFKRRYPELDIARSCAILMVMIFHLSSIVFRLPQGLLTKAFSWGWHGVDLFFVLSGFLIGGQIIEENLAGGFSFKRFFLKRFWRIMPPYYAAVAASFVFALAWNGWELLLVAKALYKDVFVHAVYLQNYIRPMLQGGLFWSLAVEEQFYMSAPVVLYLTSVYLRQRFLPILLFLVGLGAALKFILYSPEMEWWMDVLVPFQMRFDSLVAGVLTAYLFIRYGDRIKRAFFIRAMLLAAAAITLGLSFVYGGFGAGYFNTGWQFTLTYIGFSCLVLYVVVFNSAGRLPAWLKKFAGYAALLSYTMYLYHVIVMAAVETFCDKLLRLDRSSLLSFAVVVSIYLPSVFIVSAVIYRLIDEKCMSHRKKAL